MSPTEVVHPVPVDEIEPWLASLATTFLSDPAEAIADAPARARSWDASRAWGARADGRWVATLRTVPRFITAPGPSGAPGTVPDIAADALTNVTVSATHRRQGLLRTMLSESLDAAKERGDPVSILVAAEWPIYGRFGYAAAADSAHYTVRTREPGSRLLVPPSGRVRQVEARELGELAPEIFDRARVLRAGNIDRPSYWWDREFGRNGVKAGAHGSESPLVHIVHEGTDGVDGYVSWRSTGDWSLTGDLGEVTVPELVAANDEAYLGLWHYLFGLDVVYQVHLPDRPVDEPLRWLLADGRAIRQTHRIDFMWLRILDLPAALTARRYRTEDSLVLEIVDPEMPTADDRTRGAGYAAGTYRLETGPDGATCTPTTRSADLRVHQRAIAGCYLGGVSLREQGPTGLVEEVRSGALDRVDAMFATAVSPWCATGF